MELRDLEAYGEPGAVVYLADCVELMRLMPAGSVDVIFADPPYRLSTGGLTVRSGRLASVDKGGWDRSLGSFEKDHAFNVRWLREARRVLKPDGTLWVSGTHHIIFSLGFALQRLGFRVINNIVWSKPNPTPNALHTAFTHSHETLIWASKSRSSRHTFNYDLINSPNPEGQLSSVWRIPTVPSREKHQGYHPTQKPLRLLRRALLASQWGRGILSSTRSVALARLGWQPRSWGDLVGAEMEAEFCELAARRIGATQRGGVLRGDPAPRHW